MIFFLFPPVFGIFFVGRVWYCGLGRFKMITFVDVGLRCSPEDMLMKYNSAAQVFSRGISANQVVRLKKPIKIYLFN